MAGNRARHMVMRGLSAGTGLTLRAFRRARGQRRQLPTFDELASMSPDQLVEWHRVTGIEQRLASTRVAPDGEATVADRRVPVR